MRWLKLSAAGMFVLAVVGVTSLTGMSADDSHRESSKRRPTASDYVVIGWNDLGMHCISPNFDKMAILPPYNNLMAQVLKRGNPPRIVTSGIQVDYSIRNNTTVHGKTNFWQYADELFGVNLPEGVGLTGNGLAGSMQAVGDRFEATGIPVLPLKDDFTWDPYQRAVITVRDNAGTMLAQTEAVLPVSDELHCDYCHSNNGPGAPGIATGSVELNILTLHDRRAGTNLVNSTPVLCGTCHADNALGLPGDPSLPSLSLAMHQKHSRLQSRIPNCYDCHPGALTKCNRSAIEGMGPRGSNPNCERCHGSMANVALTIEQGRRPWLDEPTCAQCHGQAFSTGPDLYRNAHGHGGVMCAACHNSPHAWWPSKKSLDNKQPIQLQGEAGPIGERCTVCHLREPDDGGPHEGDEGEGGEDEHDDKR